MYEYLRLLQSHVETMQMWAGNAQGIMRQMPTPRRQATRAFTINSHRVHGRAVRSRSSSIGS